jgi:hypothetical protein
MTVLRSSSLKPFVTAAASRLGSAVGPDPSSFPASKAPGDVVAAVEAVFPQKAGYAGAADARSAEEFASSDQARSGSAPADYLAGLSAGDSGRADCSAGLRADGPIDCPIGLWAGDWAPHGSIPGGYSAQAHSDVVKADHSVPDDYLAQADRGERRWSLDERPAYWPAAELRRD